MAKPAQFLPVTPEDFEIIEDNPIPEEELDSETKSADLFSALKEDPEAEVTVYRQIDGYKNKEFVCSFSADKYDIADLQTKLQRDYGGGEYRIIARQGGRMRANKLLRIAGTQNPKATTQPSETLGTIDAMRQIMAEQNQRFNEMMARQNPHQKTTQEMLQEMVAMKEVLGLGQPAAPASDPITMMGAMMGVMKQMQDFTGGGGGGGGDDFSPLIKMAGDLVSTASNQPPPQLPPQQPQQIPQPIMRNPQPRPQMRKQPTQHLQAPYTPPQPEKINGVKKMINQNPMFKTGLKWALEQAAEKVDCGEVAEKILGILPENQIVEFITRPESLQELCALGNAFVEHKDWFADLIEHLKAACGKESKFSDLWAEDTPESMVDAMPNEQAPTSNELRDAHQRGELDEALNSVLGPATLGENSKDELDANELSTTDDSRGGSGNAGNSQSHEQASETIQDNANDSGASA